MKRFLLLFFSLFFLSAQLLYAQTRTVKGRVVDETGQGYPGAGISVKGTQLGAVTDIDGNFQIPDVPSDNKTLTIQAVGYQTQDYNITGNGNITVRLKTVSNELQGAVVTALGVKREKRDLGYSSSTVSSDDLMAGNNTSAISGLQGKVAGANITSSTGGPGGSTRVVLRGEKSISGNNNALIIVDGIITNNYDRASQLNLLEQVDFGNSANDLDPEEIESVTVLEGPAAAALYGSIGANGAIMITTKSGKNRSSNKKMEITVKETYTQSDILKFPDFQHEYGQGNIYAGVADDKRENFSWGLPFDGKLRPWGQVINGQQLVKPYVDQPNNIKSFFDKGKDLNDFISVAGGDDKTSYFLSLNALNSTGVVPGTFYNRYSVRFNATTQLSNNFYSSINVNYINSYSKVENTGQNVGSVYDNLYQTARDIPLWELKNYNVNGPDDINRFYSMSYVDAQGITRYGNYNAYFKNPYWVNDNYDNRNRTDRILGDAVLGYKKGKIDIFDRAGIDASADRSYYKSPAFNSQPVDDNAASGNNVSYYGDNFVSAGGYSEDNFNDMQFNNDVIASYTTDLSQDIGLNVLGGNNIRVMSSRDLSGTIDPKTNGLVIPGYYNLSNNQGPVIASNTITQRSTIGAYADIKLNYKRALFLEMTGRNDWTSTLATGNNSYFYPSVNGSWVFTEGMKGKFKDNILNYGKIRGGYASVGNDATPYVNNNPGYISTTVNSGFGSVIFPFNSVPGYQLQTTIGNPALRPERTNSYEIGTDLSFFKDRLAVSFTYYNALTVDQITPVPIPYSTGYAFEYINLGSVRNSGEEVTLRITPLNPKSSLKWTVFGTYTHNVSDVVSLQNGLSQITLGGFEGMGIVAAVGHPYGAFYGTDVQRDPQGHVIVSGDAGPNQGQPLATSQPVFLGTYQPKFIASWGTDLSFKGISLHVLFTTKQGGVFYSRDKVNLDFNGTSAETANRDPYVYPNSVIQTGPNTYVKNDLKMSPYQFYTNNEQNNLPGQGIVDASYIKLQEASIGYTLPSRIYNHTPFGSVNVSVFGNNLFIWTAKSNKYDDPEETSAGAIGNGQGFNFSARPSLRNYGISLKVTF